jgi:hypothetical protein
MATRPGKLTVAPVCCASASRSACSGIVATLDGVLARLQANPKVNAHATDALQKVVHRITNGDTGLNGATNAVGGQGGPDTSGQPTLPSQAQNHPGPGKLPGHP